MNYPLSLKLVFALSILLTADSAYSQTRVQNPIQVDGNLNFSTLISEDKRNAQIPLQNLQVSIPERNSLVDIRTAAFHVPILENTAPLKLTYDVDGFVDRKGSGRAVLIFQACGKTTIVDLDKAIESAKSKSTSTVKSEKSKSTGAANFRTRVEGSLSAETPLYFSVMLLVERDKNDVDHSAILSVDGIGVEFESILPSKK